MEETDALAIVDRFRNHSLSANECAVLIGQYAYRYSEEIRKDRDYWKGKVEALRKDLDSIVEGAPRG